MASCTTPSYEKIIKFKSFLTLQKFSLIALIIVFLINISAIIFGINNGNFYSDAIGYLNVYTRFIQAVVFIALTAIQIYCITSDKKAKENAISVTPTVIFGILTVANTAATYIIYNHLSNGF